MATKPKPFWQSKPMHEFSIAEWEAICDNCGRCCLQKLEDEETGEVYYTDVVCRYFDEEKCQCMAYQNRTVLVPQCVKLEHKDIDQRYWLPSTCSYKVLYDYGSLPPWHPLITGEKHSVEKVGVSIKGKVISEESVNVGEWEERIIHWVD